MTPPTPAMLAARLAGDALAALAETEQAAIDAPPNALTFGDFLTIDGDRINARAAIAKFAATLDDADARNLWLYRASLAGVGIYRADLWAGEMLSAARAQDERGEAA